MLRSDCLPTCRHLSKGATATVRIKLDNRPIPLETFKDNKDLGRIMLRKGGETVAAGVVTQVYFPKKKLCVLFREMYLHICTILQILTFGS
jgi:sulfate adenylyltransferase subunit 1 (EFTu-like GTPase family)